MVKTGRQDDRTNLLQNESIQHYVGAIRVLLDAQIRCEITETRREDIVTNNFKNLIALV